MRIVIVGGGASGVLLAANLLTQSPSVRVCLIERRDRLGAGIAYGTEHPLHLLNVRAHNMSAFADDPDHFCRWACDPTAHGGGLGLDGGSFAPRRIYGAYLRFVLDEAVRGTNGDRFELVHGEAVGLRLADCTLNIELADGKVLLADRLVLATGNEGMPLPPHGRRMDGWSADALRTVSSTAAIAIVGTGLTMTDQVLSLIYGEHRGPITAFSRRGLTHQAHLAGIGAPLTIDDVPLGLSLSKLCRWIRQRVKVEAKLGQDWRTVIDGLRPHTQALWQDLSDDDKRRFIRHARPFWDVHRHRMAPQARAVLDSKIASGQLRIVTARVQGFRESDDAVTIEFVRRGETKPDELSVGAVLECRGRSGSIESTSNPLLRSMLANGDVRADRLGLGVEVTLDCNVISADGRKSSAIFAVGPITSGMFWEIVAVPDIRLQTARLARQLLGR